MGNLQPPAFIFANEISGLGNRLRALLGYQAISACSNVPFFLCWPATIPCSAKFEDLFECRHISLLDQAKLRERQNNVARIFTVADWPDDIWAANGRCSWDSFLSQLKVCISELKPRPEIASEVMAFAEANPVSVRTGIHIRATDNIAEYNVWPLKSPHKFDRTKVSREEGYVRCLDAAADEGGIFLATDNPKTESALKARYGHRIITFPKTYASNISHNLARATSVQVALIEMLLLGQCRRVVGTYYSSFGRIAAMLGRRPYLEIQGIQCVDDPVIPSASKRLYNSMFL